MALHPKCMEKKYKIRKEHFVHGSLLQHYFVSWRISVGWWHSSFWLGWVIRKTNNVSLVSISHWFHLKKGLVVDKTGNFLFLKFLKHWIVRRVLQKKDRNYSRLITCQLGVLLKPTSHATDISCKVTVSHKKQFCWWNFFLYKAWKSPEICHAFMLPERELSHFHPVFSHALLNFPDFILEQQNTINKCCNLVIVNEQGALLFPLSWTSLGEIPTPWQEQELAAKPVEGLNVATTVV